MVKEVVNCLVDADAPPRLGLELPISRLSLSFVSLLTLMDSTNTTSTTYKNL
ncbi:hypothetical protein [Pyrobaculum sp.]|uniref:hypothetical protein n=1 Tax=Pyrobaculum sp. TaxID=2004705 RepID=UPI000B0F6416